MRNSMQAVLLTGFGETDVLKLGNAEKPEAGPGEVLIRVAATAVNRGDIFQRQGHYPPPPGASQILGLEVSGEISARGPGAEDRWKVGDAVCALVPGGGYAEYCVAHSGCCLPVPDGITLENSASLPEAAFTVWANLFDPRRLYPGDRFLMQGGTSGIGTFAIQAVRTFGVAVAATASSAEKCRFLTELGCERALNYREEDWVAGALEWSGSKGVNAILDMVGGDYFTKHLELLAQDGRLVHIAALRGNEVNLDLRKMMTKRLIITGSTVRPRSAAEKRRLRDGVEEHFWPLVRRGNIRPIVDHVFSMADVAGAHERMESSLHIGKIVLKGM